VLGKVTDEAGLRAFIEEHPEELAAALERHSLRLEAEGAEGGAKRVENAASHEGGLASETYAKLRGKTPSGEIKSYVNLGKTPPYPDPALPGRTVRLGRLPEPVPE
jgi:hypothetical protein